MNRRELFKGLAALTATSINGRLLAAPASLSPQNSRFLLVFLRGGYDAASLLVPVSSSFYYESRPNIAIARPTPGSQVAEPQAASSLDANWGLHPALNDSLYRFYQAGQLAFVPFAGTDDMTRSHFETQDSIELGQPLGGHRDFQSGFLNRLVGVLGKGMSTNPVPPAIAFTSELPLSFRGSMQIANLSLANLSRPGVDERQSQMIRSMYQGTGLAGQVGEGFAVRDEALHDMADEMDNKNPNAMGSRKAVSAKGFEQVARRMAKMMSDRYQIGFVDVGGWDTHVGQGGASGYLATRLADLGQGLATFADEMGPAWNNTVVVVLSEFGRTFRENGNRGTDHGHGSVHWVLGGGIQGGRIAGEQVAITPNSLKDNRDFPVLNEYRGILGGMFARLYGLNQRQLDQVFPDSQVRDLGLV